MSFIKIYCIWIVYIFLFIFIEDVLSLTQCEEYAGVTFNNGQLVKVASMCFDTKASGTNVIVDVYKANTVAASGCACEATVSLTSVNSSKFILTPHFSMQPNYRSCGSRIEASGTGGDLSQACSVFGDIPVQNNDVISIKFLKEKYPEDDRYCLLLVLRDAGTISVKCFDPLLKAASETTKVVRTSESEIYYSTSFADNVTSDATYNELQTKDSSKDIATDIHFETSSVESTSSSQNTFMALSTSQLDFSRLVTSVEVRTPHISDSLLESTNYNNLPLLTSNSIDSYKNTFAYGAPTTTSSMLYSSMKGLEMPMETSTVNIPKITKEYANSYINIFTTAAEQTKSARYPTAAEQLDSFITSSKVVSLPTVDFSLVTSSATFSSAVLNIPSFQSSQQSSSSSEITTEPISILQYSTSDSFRTSTIDKTRHLNLYTASYLDSAKKSTTDGGTRIPDISPTMADIFSEPVTETEVTSSTASSADTTPVFTVITSSTEQTISSATTIRVNIPKDEQGNENKKYQLEIVIPAAIASGLLLTLMVVVLVICARTDVFLSANSSLRKPENLVERTARYIVSKDTTGEDNSVFTGLWLTDINVIIDEKKMTMMKENNSGEIDDLFLDLSKIESTDEEITFL